MKILMAYEQPRKHKETLLMVEHANASNERVMTFPSWYNPSSFESAGTSLLPLKTMIADTLYLSDALR